MKKLIIAIGLLISLVLVSGCIKVTMVCYDTISTSPEAPDHTHEWCTNEEYTKETNAHTHKINVEQNIAESAGTGPHTHILR